MLLNHVVEMSDLVIPRVKAWHVISGANLRAAQLSVCSFLEQALGSWREWNATHARGGF